MSRRNRERRPPWPKDAVMIVAARAGEARLEHMEGIHPCACRDCGVALHADTFTVRTAEQLPEVVRRGRPVMFFCLDCFPKYDAKASICVTDHSGGKGKAIREAGELVRRFTMGTES